MYCTSASILKQRYLWKYKVCMSFCFMETQSDVNRTTQFFLGGGDFIVYFWSNNKYKQIWTFEFSLAEFVAQFVPPICSTF